MIKAVIFDADGVIINSFMAAFKRHCEIATELGLTPPSLQIFRQHFGKEWKQDFLNALAMELNWPAGGVDKFIEEYIKDYHNFNYPPMPKAKEVLTALSQQGIKLAIISNRQRATLNLRFNRAGIDQNLFFQILTPENVKFRKPDPRVFDSLLRELKQKNIAPTEVVYVGDTVKYDLAAAKNHTPPLHFIGITSGAATTEEFLQAGLPKKFIISSLEEIIPIIKSL